MGDVLPLSESYERFSPNSTVDVEDEAQAFEAIRAFGEDLKAATGLDNLVLEMFFTEKQIGNQTVFRLETMQTLGTATKIHQEGGIHLVLEKKALLPRTVAVMRDIANANWAIFRAFEHLD